MIKGFRRQGRCIVHTVLCTQWTATPRTLKATKSARQLRSTSQRTKGVVVTRDARMIVDTTIVVDSFVACSVKKVTASFVTKPGHFRAECPMMKEVVKLKAEKHGKSSSFLKCDLCDGLHRFSSCPKVSRCRTELNQALGKKDLGGKSEYLNKVSQSSFNRLPMTLRILTVLEKDAV